MKADFRNDVIALKPAPFWIVEAFGANCFAHVLLHKLGIIICCPTWRTNRKKYLKRTM